MNYFSHKFFTALCFGEDLDLIDACVLPDEDEAQNGYSCHFFNPVTGKCFLGTEDSAKNRFLWHLTDFLVSKDKEKLGRAIHYLEDMCTPVHTQYEDAADAIIQLKRHANFEEGLDNFLEAGGSQAAMMRFKSISEIIDCCPCDSSEIYYRLKIAPPTIKEFSDVYSLVVSSLASLKGIFPGIIGKTFIVDGQKINVLFENGKMLPSCLNVDYLLRYNGVDNIVVYKRENKFSNFHMFSNIF